MLGEPGLYLGELGLAGFTERGQGVARLLGEGAATRAVAALGGGGGPQGGPSISTSTRLAAWVPMSVLVEVDGTGSGGIVVGLFGTDRAADAGANT